MDGKSMRWEGFSLKVNTGSRMVNTDSRKWGKSVHVQQESLFTFDRNGCSRWAGIGVQLAREYATEARLIARLTITECIELCNISERTWYRWRQSGAPTWAVRLILSQHASLDRFGWHDWEIRNGALHWNQLHHRYFWTPERLVLPLYNIQNSAAPWHAYADNLSSLEAAREAQKRAKTLQTKDIEPIPNLPTYAHNIYYVK